MSETKKLAPTKVVIPCRLSYAHIWEPKSLGDDSPERYSVACLIPKSDTATIEKVKKAIEAAKEAGKADKWNGKVPSNLRMPLRDGDDENHEGDKNYNGHVFLNAASRDAPQIVDRRKNPVTDRMAVYSGCYCNVSINFYAYDVRGNKGIAAGLGNIQFVRDGERLGGKASADSDFDDLGDDTEPPFDLAPDYLS